MCLTASFLASGGFVKLFHKSPWFSMIIQVFFKNSMIFPCMELFIMIFQFFHDFQSWWEPCCPHEAWVLNYPLNTQKRLWLEWVDAQDDPSLRFRHNYFVGLGVSWLIRMEWACVMLYFMSLLLQHLLVELYVFGVSLHFRGHHNSSLHLIYGILNC